MKQREKILERLVNAADLRAEPLPCVPLVELAGERRVLIENHQGVVQYGSNEICVKVTYGRLRICGNNLELARMTKDQLVITGLIEGVQLCRGR